MFTKPANEIEFQDVKNFCDEFGEGIRVEYKQEIKDIPKIVSSFANTLGGAFIIGAETDKKTNKVIAIDGIPNSGGLEEQIHQSALTGIYPAVMPEVIILDHPTNLNHVVIIIRVDESPQAPHAIQNSTRVYIRVESITQPYKLELAEIDRIEYMLKRRADSQIVTQQILNRIEERTEALFNTKEPNLTVIARPVFPYRPVISTEDIYNFAMESTLFGTHLAKVAGGVAEGFPPRTLTRADHDSYTYLELNEYGIIYNRSALIRESSRIPVDGNNGTYLIFAEFVWKIGALINQRRFFYEKCGYSGNIEVTAQLRQIFGEKIKYGDESRYQIEEQRSADSEVSASTQYLPRDLVKREKFIEVIDELAGQLLWAFNVHVSDPQNRRDMVEYILIRNSLLKSRPK